MRSRYLLLALVGLSVMAAGPCSAKPVATPTAAKASPPKPFGATAVVANDTLRITAAACQVSGNTTGCHVSLTGAITPLGSGVGFPIAFAPVPDLAPGQTLTVTQTITCTDRATVSVTVSSIGFNAAGQQSVARGATGTATCPAGPPVQPGAFTVTIIISAGG